MFSQVNIEINTHCSHRCRFCPQRLAPKAARAMSNALFAEVLAKIAEAQPSPEWVALNHYGEPLLDPDFLIKARLLADLHWPLRLFTNAGHLDKPTARALKAFGNLETIAVNLPDLDPVRYRQKTGAGDLGRVLENVDGLFELELPVVILVNGNDRQPELVEIAGALQQRWPGATTILNLAHTRAGLIASPETQAATRNDAPCLPGCSLLNKQLNIAVDGTLFLCCQDYHQVHTFGQATLGIVGALAMQGFLRLRDMVFGHAPAAPDFICRRCNLLGS